MHSLLADWAKSNQWEPMWPSAHLGCSRLHASRRSSHALDSNFVYCPHSRLSKSRMGVFWSKIVDNNLPGRSVILKVELRNVRVRGYEVQKLSQRYDA